MSGTIRLWDWEEAILRQLLYDAPDGGSEYMSLREAAISAGHPHIHPDKLRGFSKKLAALGYGQAEIREISVPSIDIDFKLSMAGHQAASNSIKKLQYFGPLERVSSIDWSTVSAVISAAVAIVSAIIAYRVS